MVRVYSSSSIGLACSSAPTRVTVSISLISSMVLISYICPSTDAMARSPISARTSAAGRAKSTPPMAAQHSAAAQMSARMTFFALVIFLPPVCLSAAPHGARRVPRPRRPRQRQNERLPFHCLAKRASLRRFSPLLYFASPAARPFLQEPPRKRKTVCARKQTPEAAIEGAPCGAAAVMPLARSLMYIFYNKNRVVTRQLLAEYGYFCNFSFFCILFSEILRLARLRRARSG